MQVKQEELKELIWSIKKPLTLVDVAKISNVNIITIANWASKSPNRGGYITVNKDKFEDFSYTALHGKPRPKPDLRIAVLLSAIDTIDIARELDRRGYNVTLISK